MSRRRAVALGFGGLVLFSLFFLVRPFLDAAPACRARPPGTTYAYSFLVVAAFVPYVAAVWGARRGIGLRWAVAGTVVLHLLVLPAALTQSQDLYAYLFYGKMWASHGANPYVDLPLRFAADPWFPWLRWAGQTSVYGPIWTMLTGGAAGLAGGSLPAAFALTKSLVGLLGTATVLGGIRAARDRGIDAGSAVVLAAWNPLVIVSLPLGAHADVAVAACLVWALVADRRGHPLLAAAALAGGTLVKAYTGIALLVYLVALARRSAGSAIRAAGLSLVMGVLAWAPFWDGLRTLEGLAGIAGGASASLGGTIQFALDAALPTGAAVWVVRGAGLVVVTVVVAEVARRASFPADPWPGVAAAFAAYVAVTPWFLYWHLVGVLVLVAVGAASTPLGAATVTFSGTAMLTAGFGGTWWGRVVQTALRYGLPAAAWIRSSTREGTAGTPPRSPQPPRSSAGTPEGLAPAGPRTPPPR